MNLKLASTPMSYARLAARLPAGDDAMTVLASAARIETDPHALLTWYSRTPISELDGLTAQALVASGRAAEVVAFLREIIEARRG